MPLQNNYLSQPPSLKNFQKDTGNYIRTICSLTLLTVFLMAHWQELSKLCLNFSSYRELRTSRGSPFHFCTSLVARKLFFIPIFTYFVSCLCLLISHLKSSQHAHIATSPSDTKGNNKQLAFLFLPTKFPLIALRYSASLELKF